MLHKLFFNANKSHLYHFIKVIFISLFSFYSCTSSLNKSSIKSLQNQKALVFYASDDPLWLPYFSNAFTRRISSEGLYETVHNRELNKEWMLNSVGKRENMNMEFKFSQFAIKIKNFIKLGQMQQARNLANTSMKEAAQLLSQNPSSVSFSYAILAFWSAAANLNSSKQYAKNYALIYEKYASFSLKDSLESQIDSHLIDQLKLLTSDSLMKQKSVKIINSNLCSIFVNGQELKSDSVLLPLKMPSVLSASCTNGSYSKFFSSEKITSIKISPQMPNTFYSMPHFSALPREQIQALRPAIVILIFWSHSGKYLESCMVDPKSFLVVKKTRISLSSKKDLDEAGDNLIMFLKSVRLASFKIYNSDLTSSRN
ncbi:hypothetical protein [Silvanigrella aquatica]|uniref:Lipoprotein n=1 Tax=Silvanigrella aquatica TaxID=1915309 RepID=A0A1L4D0M3_9BACT|nr:hypothetical protein [Silvanigrella aquatica]APJ03737.1 hypothetical protein AXG55_07385 [Silvanigrella aquatica]